jgi:hypothetical protein
MERAAGRPLDRRRPQQRERHPLPGRLPVELVDPRGGQFFQQKWMHDALLS